MIREGWLHRQQEAKQKRDLQHQTLQAQREAIEERQLEKQQIHQALQRCCAHFTLICSFYGCYHC